MLDLRTIERAVLPAGLGLVMLKVEDYRAMVSEIAELQVAIAPFAKAAKHMNAGKAIPPEHAGIWTAATGDCRVSVADFQRAAKAGGEDGTC